MHAALENFEASLKHKGESLEMFRALYGSSHPEVARALLSLGEMYALSGKLEESLRYKQGALSMFQSLYHEAHPEVTQASLSLNATYQLTQGEESSTQTTGPSLRPVRTAHPQHLTLLPTPRHGKEPAGENTKLREYYRQENFSHVKSLFGGKTSKRVDSLECELQLREQKEIKTKQPVAQDAYPRWTNVLQLIREDQPVAQDARLRWKNALQLVLKREDQVAAHDVRLTWVTTPIGLEDLFKPRSTHPHKPIKKIQRVLVTGAPGTGKTTLSKKLAYQWSVGAWGQEFHTVYVGLCKKP